MKCMCKQNKWLIIIATVGLILGCFVLSKLMAAPHSGGHSGGHSSGHEHHDGRGGRDRRGWGGRGGYWGGVGVGVDVDPYYYDDPYVYGSPYYNRPVVVEPVGPSVGFGIGVGRGW